MVTVSLLVIASMFSVYYAAQEGHLDCVHWLVERAGADPRAASHDGMTPLHAAAQTGRLNVTHWLVRTANCSIACRTSDGATPVHFAAAKGERNEANFSSTYLKFSPPSPSLPLPPPPPLLPCLRTCGYSGVVAAPLPSHWSGAGRLWRHTGTRRCRAGPT